MLEINRMSVRYGPVQALSEVSICVSAGEIVALIGSNGAGKTTTLKGVMGLQPVASGAISLEGYRIERLPAFERVARGLAYSPEGRRLFPQLTVLENLQVGSYLQRDRAWRERILERVYHYFPKLAERRKQLAGTLSGGEQQMVALGRALMADPKLLLLDEPSLGLAPMMVNTISDIIREINRELGVAMMLVEQNARMALRLCHRAYVLETGRVAIEGAGPELLGSDYVRRLYLGT